MNDLCKLVPPESACLPSQTFFWDVSINNHSISQEMQTELGKPGAHYGPKLQLSSYWVIFCCELVILLLVDFMDQESRDGSLRLVCNSFSVHSV